MWLTLMTTPVLSKVTGTPAAINLSGVKNMGAVQVVTIVLGSPGSLSPPMRGLDRRCRK
jgi:hypothetical protein